MKGENTMKIKVKNKKQFDETVKEYRNKGYMIVTFWKNFAELEKNNEIVIIERG